MNYRSRLDTVKNLCKHVLNEPLTPGGIFQQTFQRGRQRVVRRTSAPPRPTRQEVKWFNKESKTENVINTNTLNVD